MLKYTTFKLPEALVAKSKAYAATHGTTMTAIVRQHLEAVTSDGASDVEDDPLLSYSQGRLGRHDALRLLVLRDYTELLIALGDAELPMPLPPPQEVDSQAARFAELWTSS